MSWTRCIVYVEGREQGGATIRDSRYVALRESRLVEEAQKVVRWWAQDHGLEAARLVGLEYQAQDGAWLRAA